MVVDDMMASHSLHLSIVNGLIIILTIFGRRLANLLGLSILPLDEAFLCGRLNTQTLVKKNL